MGFLKNQFSNLVEWNESEEGVIFYKWQSQEIKKVVLFSFLAGAVNSLYILIRNRNFYNRFVYFSCYFKAVLLTKSIPRYDFKSDGKQNYIHFSVAILAGDLMYLGGI